MNKQKLPEGWKEIELGEVLDYEQPGDYIVDSDEYNDEYETPVLTAGKSFILGYTNEKMGIYTKLPVIIFDDFTTANKFVTFPFKVKSSAMKLLTPKTDNVNLKFVFWLMQTINVNFITHKRYYLSKYQHIKIALPPIETQKAIVKILEKVEKAKELRKEADELTKDFLKSVFLEMFGDKDKFEIIKIKDVIEKTSNDNPTKDYPDKNFEYIDISSIDNNKGKIISCKKMLGKDAPSRAKQKVHYNDLIISTVRPNLNSVALIPKNLHNQICSTGFCVLRANIEKVSPEFLFHVSRSSKFIGLMVKIAKGASYPAISDRDIKDYELPLPPIELQNKFASIVQQVEAIKEQQKHSKNQIDNLFNALMQKAFKGELEI